MRDPSYFDRIGEGVRVSEDKTEEEKEDKDSEETLTNENVRTDEDDRIKDLKKSQED